MFSLIITLIAIALVAALALATLYYGGPIFNEGADRAQAAKIEAQGQQIMGAMELYHAEKGVYPNALTDLVTDEYLRSIPTAAAEQAQLVASALAATGTWSLISPGQPVIVMKPVSLAACKSFNSVNIGVAGVLKQAHSTKLKQCIGPDVNNLMIVQPKAVADLLYVAADVGAAVQIGAVLATPIPALSDTSANGFLDTTAPAALTYAVSYSAPTLAFTDTSVGSTSAAQSVTVTNTGTGALTITGATASAPFAVSNSTCTSLAPGATCAVSVTFSPAAAQAFTGASYALTLQSLSGLSPLLLSGTGTGVLVAQAPSLTAGGYSYLYEQMTDGPATSWFYRVTDALAEGQSLDACLTPETPWSLVPSSASADWMLFRLGGYDGAWSAQTFTLTVPSGTLAITGVTYTIGGVAPRPTAVGDAPAGCEANACAFLLNAVDGNIRLPVLDFLSPFWNLTYAEEGAPITLDVTYTIDGGPPQVITHTFVIRTAEIQPNSCR